MSVPYLSRFLQWPVIEDCLVVGGMPLPDFARQVGRTPFYAYDRRIIDERVASLRRLLPPQIRLLYAVKANPMPEVVRHLVQRVDGLDVASAGELQTALAAGADAQNVSFAGPGKTATELETAARAHILVSVESFREIRTLAQIARESGPTARVAIRINPDFVVKSSGVRMGGGPSAFGIDAECVPEAVRQVIAAGLRFEGFHAFTGSQSLSANAVCDAHQRKLALMLEIAEATGVEPRRFNIGGGLGIPYFAGDAPIDEEQVCENVTKLAGLVESRFPRAELALELGRYLVGEAGIYVCRVVDRKTSRGKVFLVTNGGMHHHLSASGHFGQVVRRDFPVAIGNHMNTDVTETVTIVGPLCTPLDLLADRVELPAAREGDFVVIFQSGAYGLTASPTAFLSHPRPEEVLV